LKYTSLKENHLFAKAYKKGSKAVTRTAVVYILPDYRAKALKAANPLKEKINRLGITVSRRAKTAVERNRCRRVLREGYRLLCKENSVKKGYLVVIVARDASLCSKSSDVKRDLKKAFKELGMLI